MQAVHVAGGPMAVLAYRRPYKDAPDQMHLHWWQLSGDPDRLSLCLDSAMLPILFRVSQQWAARPFVQLYSGGRMQLVTSMPVEFFMSENQPPLTVAVVPAGKRFEVVFTPEELS
jgi:hypothetical protein